MPGIVKFKLEGAAELDKALRTLGPRVATNISGRALRAMAKPIVQRARQLVPVRTGRLRKSIMAKLDRVRGASRTMKIGFRRGMGRSSIAHLVEYGTAHSAPQPFMRPSLDEKAHVALSEMGRVLGNGIELEAQKRGFTGASDTGEMDINL